MRFAWARPSMARKVVEGSYYILLTYILLSSILPIYITAETHHRCKIPTAFLKHTDFRKTMAHFMPDQLFYHSPHYPASDYSTQMRPLSTRQADEFSFEALSCNNDQTTVSLDQYNVDRTGALRLDKETINYSLKTGILRRPTLSSLGVSGPSIPTATSDHPIPGLTVNNTGDPQDTMTTHGPALSVAASNNCSLQEDTLRQQLTAAVYGSLPIPPEFSNRRNLPRDATPLKSISSRGSGNPTYLAADSTAFNPENVPYTPRPSQPLFGPFNADGLEPSPDYDPSNHSAPHYDYPNTNLNHLGASGISASVLVSNQHRRAPKEATFNVLGSPNISARFKTSSPHHSAPNTSSSGIFKPLCIPTPSQKSTIRRSKMNTKKYNRVGSLSSLPTRHIAPMVNVNNIKRRQKFSGRCVINSNGPTLLSSYTEDKYKEQDPFELYTHHYDNDADEWTVAGFDAPSAPNVDNNFVSGARESHAGQCSAGHLGGDADSGDMSQPQQKPQQRNKVKQTEKAKAESRQKPQQRNKVQKTERAKAESRQKTQRRNKVQQTERAKAERRQPSTESRRTNPKKRYFCAYPDCKRTEEHGWHGFPNITERDRHHKCHLPKEYHCALHHVDGEEVKWFRRREGLKKYVFPTV